MNFQFIAKKYGTPVYVYDGNRIIENCTKVLNLFDSFKFFPTFALKSNNNPNIVRLIHSQGFGADVVSKGELLASFKAGVKPFEIVWNGNGKRKDEMEYFLNHNVGYVNVDSFEEMERWIRLLEGYERKIKTKFLLRVNPNIDSHTHPHISTGLRKNKFGVDISKVDEFMRKFGKYVCGFHVHIGSQITETEPFTMAYEQILSLLIEYDLEYFNLGGGWGVDYGDGKYLNLDEYKGKVISILKKFDGKILVELGRFLVCDAGYIILKVIDVKKGYDKIFVVVDGGMNILMRPALYGAYHEVITIDGTGNLDIVDIVGPLCESGDFIARDVKIEIPKVGGLIVVKNCGAYGFSMSNNYNSFPKPPEVLVLNDEDYLIRRRETEEEIFSHVVELDFSKLKFKKEEIE